MNNEAKRKLFWWDIIILLRNPVERYRKGTREASPHDNTVYVLQEIFEAGVFWTSLDFHPLLVNRNVCFHTTLSRAVTQLMFEKKKK